MKRLLLCLCLLISRHVCEEAEVVGDQDVTIIDEDDIEADIPVLHQTRDGESKQESSSCMIETVAMGDKGKYYVNCANRNISGRLF